MSASLDRSSLKTEIMCFHHFLPVVHTPLYLGNWLRHFEMVSVMGIHRKEGSPGGRAQQSAVWCFPENRFITDSASFVSAPHHYSTLHPNSRSFMPSLVS